MEQQENIPVIRKKRELKYTGTILKFYEDTVVVNGHELARLPIGSSTTPPSRKR